ncbi:glycoside hydrolase family protein [Pelagicoccus mobilis]|uniref:Glycoside hydrolase family protein n=1 Tax=Pelagicoccus mobilis TaxID=415221 RepID=A0A934S1L5_9BACT|nr:glycoside hydrolase family protein [Pelagicoccus mobilis]MBK1878941.1 glycoside hydrolase family protein [Pelagicoccus mobilis]
MKAVLATLALGLALVGCQSETEDKDYKVTFGKIPMTAKFEDDTWSIWGGSLVKGDDGLYHMYYSRWERDKGWAWVTDSEIAHAVSESPFGPFEFKDVALPPRGEEYWDGLCTHNPTVRKFGDKYYIYYMGNTGDGKIIGYPGKHIINWDHRNNQRIGVAVSDSPYGPWKRFDEPLIDISPEKEALDSLCTSNPSIVQRPDGGFLMVYKIVGQEYPLPQGGPVLHGIANSDSPTGPFVKHDKPTFKVPGERFPAEDPYIWHQDGKYRAIVKRIQHLKNEETGKTHREFSLVHYQSEDGFQWDPAKHFHVSDRTIEWEDGTVERLDHLERPQVFIEDGKPIALLCAGDIYDENNVRMSYNVQIPITYD